MATEALGGLVLTQISEDDINWKTIVCEDKSAFNGTSSVSETKTKCGIFSAPTTNAPTIAGSGIAGGDLVGGECSYLDLQKYRDAKTKLYIRRQNSASGTLAAGEITYAHGRGYVTEASDDATEGENVKFNFTLTFTGTVHFVAGS